jgi:type IV pilus assembly protein PilC
MAKNFYYKAKDYKGQLHTGNLLADNEKAVALHIQAKGYFVLQIKEQSNIDSTFYVLLKRWHTAKLKDVAIVCRQLSTMVDAGLSLITCLSILIEQTDNGRIRAALQSVYIKVKEGETLSQALAEHPHIFPVIMVNMVEAGEVGGVLDEVLMRLATYFEKEHRLNEKIKSALTYPVVVMVVAVLALTFIITFVLPSFITFFINMKVEVPWATRILLTISNLLNGYWPLLLLIIAVIGAGSKMVFVQPAICKAWEQTVLSIPIVGQLVRKVAIARFCRILSTLLRGGVPLITALDVVKKVVNNLNMMESMTNAQQKLQEGVTLATTLASSQVFTPMVIQMVAVGEESGTVDKLLEKVADFYESEIDDTLSRLSSIIEPVIVGVLGIVIGFIVIAVVLPLFDVIANAGNGKISD